MEDLENSNSLGVRGDGTTQTESIAESQPTGNHTEPEDVSQAADKDAADSQPEEPIEFATGHDKQEDERDIEISATENNVESGIEPTTAPTKAIDLEGIKDDSINSKSDTEQKVDEDSKPEIIADSKAIEDIKDDSISKSDTEQIVDGDSKPIIADSKAIEDIKDDSISKSDTEQKVEEDSKPEIIADSKPIVSQGTEQDEIRNNDPTTSQNKLNAIPGESDKPESDKPESDKPDSDKPDSDKPDSDKPALEEPNQPSAVSNDNSVESDVPMDVTKDAQDEETARAAEAAETQNNDPQQSQQPIKDTTDDNSDITKFISQTSTSEKIENLSDDDIEIDEQAASSSSSSESDSDSDSDSSSDSDSDSSSESDTEARPALKDEDIDELGDDEEPQSVGPILSTNEVLDEKAPTLPEDYQVPENSPLEHIGEVTGLVEKSVIIKANISGEFRVLKDGSIFCFEDRTLLGPLFETFGKLQSPIYRVKFNTDEDFSKFKDRKGAKVFYVVPESEFLYTDAIKNLRGTDASNCHDEELPEEEQEFSDDEREAAVKAAKKKQKKSKGKKKSNDTSTETSAAATATASTNNNDSKDRREPARNQPPRKRQHNNSNNHSLPNPPPTGFTPYGYAQPAYQQPPPLPHSLPHPPRPVTTQQPPPSAYYNQYQNHTSREYSHPSAQFYPQQQQQQQHQQQQQQQQQQHQQQQHQHQQTQQHAQTQVPSPYGVPFSQVTAPQAYNQSPFGHHPQPQPHQLPYGAPQNASPYGHPTASPYSQSPYGQPYGQQHPPQPQQSPYGQPYGQPPVPQQQWSAQTSQATLQHLQQLMAGQQQQQQNPQHPPYNP